MTHETKAPESTSHAALGLLGATFSSNPIQGYEKGQNVYKQVRQLLILPNNLETGSQIQVNGKMMRTQGLII